MTDRAKPSTAPDLLTNPTEAARIAFGPAFERLVGIMAKLRQDCPWDRAQDLQSLKAYLLEEAYEVLEAIDADDPEAHVEELGDLLLQVVFQAEIRRGQGHFDAADVAHAIADKLVRRHPHVFGAAKAHTKEEVVGSWEAIKAQERAAKGQPDQSVLSGVPKALPALLRAQKVGEKASRVGFDWGDMQGPIDKVHEEIAELMEALASKDPAAITHELGDCLFALVNVARYTDTQAEAALQQTVNRFSKRFRHVEAGARAQDRPLSELSLKEMDVLWDEAKVLEKKA